MDLTAAKLFLQQLSQEENPTFAFRAFTDDKNLLVPGSPDPNAVTRYGKFEDLQNDFIRLNNLGAGIFHTVNVTDGKGYGKANVTRIRAVFADLDGVDPEPAMKFRMTPNIVVESSKGKFHCYWIVDPSTPLALAMFEPVQKAIADRFKSDPSVCDLGRVLRLPGFFHRKKEPFLVNIVSTSESPKFYTVKQILDAFSVTESGKARNLPAAIPQGQRETRLLSFAGSMRRVGGTEESILAALKIENQRCVPPMEIADLVRISSSVCKYPVTSGDFIRDQNGKIYPGNTMNVRIAMEKVGVRVQYDQFARRYEVIRTGEKEPKHLDDAAMTRLWLEVDESFAFRPSYELFTKIILDEAIHKNSYHPVCEYLDSLKWDGVERIDDWLVQYGQAADSTYCRTVGRLVLLAAVRRVRQPGCKFDEMLVLESAQGKDKSSILKALCPNDRWFSDNLPLNADSKVVIEQTSGKWIVEAAELSGMRKGEVEHLKSFLSRDTDIARMSYERMTLERPRHFVIIGTTNSNEYLKDTTGNRRFWPIRIPQFDIAKLKKDRDQLWAEAAFKEKQGASIRMDKSIWADAEIQQERRRILDPWEVSISQCLGDLTGKIFSDDVWEIVGVFDRGRRNQNDNFRIGEAMRRLGFDRAKIRDKDKTRHGYVRGIDEKERRHRIVIQIEDGQPTALHGPEPSETSTWERMQASTGEVGT